MIIVAWVVVALHCIGHRCIALLVVASHWLSLHCVVHCTLHWLSLQFMHNDLLNMGCKLIDY